MLKLLRELYERVKTVFLPDQYFAWQTFIYLSLFSWAMSWIALGVGATQFTVILLTSFSWLFLAFGVGWALNNSKANLFGIPLAPWVSGAILCAFIFGLIPGNQIELAVVTWPLIAAMIMIVPQFLGWDLERKVPPPPMRQRLILVFLLSLVLSSWLQFYFRLQSWFTDYPSLLAEDFNRSHFVYRVPGQANAVSEGVALLSLTETALAEELNNKPWPGVERWLLNIDDQLVGLRRQVRDRLSNPSLEHQFWRIEVQPVTSSNGYDLKLRAIWLGPTAEPAGYYLERSCQLARVNRTTPPTIPDGTQAAPPADASNVTVWSTLNCNLQTDRKAGRPV